MLTTLECLHSGKMILGLDVSSIKTMQRNLQESHFPSKVWGGVQANLMDWP
jgi:hypothetical protein